MDVRDCSSVEEKVTIKMKKLEIDPCNVRGDRWDGDRDFTKSIENDGLDNPLVVRPIEVGLDGTVLKWGIVDGGRRFNGAFDAGFEDIQCSVEQLNDEEASMRSMRENNLRRSTPTWKEIDFVGELIEKRCSNGLSPEDAEEKVAKSAPQSRPTITRYRLIYELPQKVRNLLREPQELSKKQRFYYECFSEHSKGILPLKIGTLVVVSEYLSGWSEREQVRASFVLNGFIEKERKKIAQNWSENTDVSHDELIRKIFTGGNRTLSVTLTEEEYERLRIATRCSQSRAVQYVEQSLREKLDRDGHYLERANEDLPSVFEV